MLVTVIAYVSTSFHLFITCYNSRRYFANNLADKYKYGVMRKAYNRIRSLCNRTALLIFLMSVLIGDRLGDIHVNGLGQEINMM